MSNADRVGQWMLGCTVWFYASSSNEPLAAVIVHVNEDGTVNLMVLSAYGESSFARQNVTMLVENKRAQLASWCRWPPRMNSFVDVAPL